MNEQSDPAWADSEYPTSPLLAATDPRSANPDIRRAFQEFNDSDTPSKVSALHACVRGQLPH